eukprot:5519894-Amphidinium_carterae.1
MMMAFSSGGTLPTAPLACKSLSAACQQDGLQSIIWKAHSGLETQFCKFRKQASLICEHDTPGINMSAVLWGVVSHGALHLFQTGSQKAAYVIMSLLYIYTHELSIFRNALDAACVSDLFEVEDVKPCNL